MKHKYRLVAFYVFLCQLSIVIGQDIQLTIDSLKESLSQPIADTTQVDVLHDLVSIYASRNPDSALYFAEKAFQLTSSLNDIERHSRSYRRIGYASYVSNDLDRLKSSLESYIEYSWKTDQPGQVAASYRNLSKIGEATKQPDSSLYYLEKCLEVLAEYPDTLTLIDVHLSKGLSYKYKGYFELSLESLLTGLRLSESLDKPYKLGYLNMNLAITTAMMKRHQESVDYSKAGIEHFKNDGNVRAITRTTNNLAIALEQDGKIDEAIKYYEEAIQMAEETKMANIAMHAHAGLANVYLSRGAIDLAKDHTAKREQIAQDIGNNFALGSTARFKAFIALEQNESETAKRNIKEAEDYFNSSREPIEESELLFEMAELHEKTDNYKKALEYYHQASAVKDSLFFIERESQFEELNLIYETEKKDAEIQLLAKSVELEQTKKRSLIGGLILLFLAAGSTILALIQRSRKNKQIHQQEKQLEIQKREAAEKELEFKKKELTAKALQLASKNEFLQKLEEQVSDLKSSVDRKVSQTSQRISRMIMMDGQEDEEWDQFSKEFSSVHSGYLDRLREQFGSFSTSETRLIYLMKMNLSSKDIANILRISADGVKKARYRLRKKMDLDSDLDIQQYLINY